jgi:hypothetical protein
LRTERTPSSRPTLLHVDELPFIRKTRITGDHEQPADPRQRGDDLLDHAVDEIVLLRVAAHIGERQRRDRRLVGKRRRARNRLHGFGGYSRRAGHWLLGLAPHLSREQIAAPRQGTQRYLLIIGENAADIPDALGKGPSLRPDWQTARAARAAPVKAGRRPPPKAARSGLDGREHATPITSGWAPIIPLDDQQSIFETAAEPVLGPRDVRTCGRPPRNVGFTPDRLPQQDDDCRRYRWWGRRR